MNEENTVQNLKVKLQSLGALQPEAWERVLQLKKEILLKPNASLIRKEGTLAYVATGLLKEYDAQNRSQPSIINFIGSKQCIYTRKNNQQHYLKACSPSKVWYWDFASLKQLSIEFNELVNVYEILCAEYDYAIDWKRLVSDEKTISVKIELFLLQYKPILPLLKKKDIANYLNLSYDYFTRHFSKAI